MDDSWGLFDFTGADGAENFETLEGNSWAGSNGACVHEPRGLLGFVSFDRYQPSKGLAVRSSETLIYIFIVQCNARRAGLQMLELKWKMGDYDGY